MYFQFLLDNIIQHSLWFIAYYNILCHALTFKLQYQFYISSRFSNEHSFSRDGPINKVTSFYDMFHFVIETFCFIQLKRLNCNTNYA